MKFPSKSRRRWLIAGGLLLAIATPSFALFGLGDIVFDPTNYAELITQATTAYTQLQTIEHNVTHFSFKGLWTTEVAQMKQANVRSVFGETDGMTTALNSDSPAAASMAWTNATTAVNSGGTAYVAGLPATSAQRSQLAMVEMSDSVSPDCLNAVGAYRAARAANLNAQANLQSQQMDTSDDTNSEVEQHNLLNAAQVQQMNESQAQGVIHACQASQMAVANMQQRNAAAQDLNTWGEVRQQQAMNPTFANGSSNTWTTYLP